MLKVVVFDSGYGGEFFADRLEEVFPVIDVVRVIDWRNADKLLSRSLETRRIVEKAIQPYIGRVDLIVFANHLLSLTSLGHYRRKYKNQKFTGLALKRPDTFRSRKTVILTTKAVTRTLKYHRFIRQLKRPVITITLDSWPNKIDDGILKFSEIEETLTKFFPHKSDCPQEIILACSQFNDIKRELKQVFGQNVRIYDSFDDTIHEISKTLRIRGGAY